MNVALTSQLATVPLPSPASGFTYHFDPATGTFVRSTPELRSDPRGSRRDDRPRQDRVRLLLSVLLLRSAGRREPRRTFPRSSPTTTSRPAAAAPTWSPPTTPSRRPSRSSPAPSPTGYQRSHRRLARRADGPDAAVAPVERDDSPDRHRQQPRRPLLPGSRCDRRPRIDASVLRGGVGRRALAIWSHGSRRRCCARARGPWRRDSTSGCRPATSRTCSAPARSA